MSESPAPTQQRYARWKAPADDGQILIWPNPSDLLLDTHDNGHRLRSADGVLLQGVPLPHVRAKLRAALNCTDDQQPIIATGHQTELHHPGVWVKNALIHIAAKKLNGVAMHVAVDTDAPKHLQLRWPGGAVALTDVEKPSVEWSGLVPAPSVGHLNAVERTIEMAERSWNFKPITGPFFESMKQQAGASPNVSTALAHSLQELDASLGLGHESPMVSPLCESQPYLLFVHHVLARAEAFAADYNAALEEFRRENKIRTPGRPMPNLKCTADGCEVPFWLDDLASGARFRATVAKIGGAMVLRLPIGTEFPLDANAEGWSAGEKLGGFLREHKFRLSPRALTLTAVLRLLLADQFVHGIGGGQYDQVLDKLIVRHFQLDPPRFSVTTATLFFAGAVGRSRACQPCILQEGHRLRHALLGEKKRALVEAIESSPRRSIERSVLFTDMHDQLAAARKGARFRDWERRFEETRLREQEEKVVFDRELFYALQPRDRLAAMVSKYRQAFES